MMRTIIVSGKARLFRGTKPRRARILGATLALVLLAGACSGDDPVDAANASSQVVEALEGAFDAAYLEYEANGTEFENEPAAQEAALATAKAALAGRFEELAPKVAAATSTATLMTGAVVSLVYGPNSDAARKAAADAALAVDNAVNETTGRQVRRYETDAGIGYEQGEVCGETPHDAGANSTTFFVQDIISEVALDELEELRSALGADAEAVGGEGDGNRDQVRLDMAEHYRAYYEAAFEGALLAIQVYCANP